MYKPFENVDNKILINFKLHSENIINYLLIHTNLSRFCNDTQQQIIRVLECVDDYRHYKRINTIGSYKRCDLADKLDVIKPNYTNICLPLIMCFYEL